MTSDNHRLMIRADASSEMGIGHVMRCIALGQFWSAEIGEVHFASQTLPAALRQRLSREGFLLHEIPSSCAGCEDAEFTKRLTREIRASALILDGYLFDDRYQAVAFAGDGIHLVMDDDGHAQHIAADCIVNLNLGARAADYAQSSAKLLLGSDYALIRREFLAAKPSSRMVSENARNILVTLGGSDPVNATSWVVESLSTCCDTSGWKIRLLLGPGYKHRKNLAQQILDYPQFQIVEAVEDVSELYLWSDMAISAGGGSNWEMSLFGVPRVVIPIADNQIPGAAAMKAAGACWTASLGDSINLATKVQSLMLSATERTRMMTASQQLVDGLGSQRITEELLKLVKWKESHGSQVV